MWENKLTVDDKEDVSDAEELTRDLMALLASFSGKFGGLTEEYWKIVNKLEEWDNKREKEIENENSN